MMEKQNLSQLGDVPTVKSILGESVLQHDDNELSEEQWNSNIEVMIEKLNKQNRGVWSMGKTEYGRRTLAMNHDGTVIAVQLKSWGSHVVNKVTFAKGLSIGKAGDEDGMPMKRITSKNVNVMINNDTVRSIIDDVFTELNKQLWTQIDCDEQSSKRHITNHRNWQDALLKIASGQQMDKTVILDGHVVIAKSLPEVKSREEVKEKSIIKVSQVRKGEFAEFNKFNKWSKHGEAVTQITIDDVHGSVSTDIRTSSSEQMRAKLIALLESGMDLKSIHVGVEGTVDEMKSLAEKLADGKEIEVR